MQTLTSDQKKSASVLLTAQAVFMGLVLVGPLVDRVLIANTGSLMKYTNIYFGVILVATGLILFLASFFKLDKSFTPNPIPKDSGALVTSGVYAFCRHPIYTAVILISIGWAFVFLSLATSLFTILLIFILRKKAIFEEQLLTAQYGKSYEEYMHKVNRFF
ncbi:MAG: isoprenylcysteine carboxylmethyltransferase family protein [Bdellovibrio sp.]|nr:isoprenylcysteine carboxylmethyltransferase family protein [Bdellovibrio sp.]